MLSKWNDFNFFKIVPDTDLKISKIFSKLLTKVTKQAIMDIIEMAM